MTKDEFQILFKSNYNGLCNYAFAMVKDHADAEDIVQGVFFDFWNKLNELNIEGKFENYLIRAVKFKCIDFHRKKAVAQKYENEAARESQFEEKEDEKEKLKDLLTVAINQLPEKTKEVFLMSKQEGMSYKEIADHLNISPKTVENQMGRAFKHLREKLKDYKDLLALLIFFWIE